MTRLHTWGSGDRGACWNLESENILLRTVILVSRLSRTFAKSGQGRDGDGGSERQI